MDYRFTVMHNYFLYFTYYIYIYRAGETFSDRKKMNPVQNTFKKSFKILFYLINYYLLVKGKHRRVPIEFTHLLCPSQ